MRTLGFRTPLSASSPHCQMRKIRGAGGYPPPWGSETFPCEPGRLLFLHSSPPLLLSTHRIFRQQTKLPLLPPLSSPKERDAREEALGALGLAVGLEFVDHPVDLLELLHQRPVLLVHLSQGRTLRRLRTGACGGIWGGGGQKWLGVRSNSKKFSSAVENFFVDRPDRLLLSLCTWTTYYSHELTLRCLWSLVQGGGGFPESSVPVGYVPTSHCVMNR